MPRKQEFMNEELVFRLFGKYLDGLTFADIETFFKEPKEESSQVEFKVGLVKQDDIHKEVCAFLNTEGGIIIIGTPKEGRSETDGRVKVCQGQLIPVPSSSFESESLMRSIYTNITPMPPKIGVKAISTTEGQVIILVVPQSGTPPHQVNSKGVYYIRLDREAKSAPHGLVEALFQKRYRPELDISVSVRKIESRINSGRLEVCLVNLGTATAESVTLVVQGYGLKGVSGHAGIFKEFRHFDESAQSTFEAGDRILVKGIDFTGSVTLEYFFDFFFLSFACYCKGGGVKIFHYLNNPAENMELLERVENNDLSLSRLFKLFENRRRTYLARRIFNEDILAEVPRDF
jgi:hypothetical protein